MKKTNSIRFLLFCLFLSFSTVLYSQTVIQDWVSRYSGIPNDGPDVPAGLILDKSDNVYVTGKSAGSGTGYDYATIKYNSSGEEQWAARYNGTAGYSDYAYDIALDNSGNIIVTGRGYENFTDYDVVTIKYDSDGNLLWINKYDRDRVGISGGIADDGGLAVAVDNSDNIYVTGYGYGEINTSYDLIVIKYNSAGVRQWVKVFGGTAMDDYGIDIAVDGNGDICVTGYVGSGASNTDYITLKYNPEGTLLWSSLYDYTGNWDFSTAMAIDVNNNIYVTGYSQSGTTMVTNDYCTIKYDPDGKAEWVRRYNGSASSGDYSYAVAVDNNGDIIVTGETYEYGTYYDATTVKYDNNGNELWSYTFADDASQTSYAIALDASDNIYITGYTLILQPQGNNFLTIKYSSEGRMQWVITYDGNRDDLSWDEGYAIAVNPSNEVFVTGRSSDSAPLYPGYTDYATIKYIQIDEKANSKPIALKLGEIPHQYRLKQNYPNPFNPSTNIGFDLPEKTQVNLAVYDYTGRIVETLINHELDAGSYSVKWDAGQYASGVYFYRLISSGYTKTEKMILVK